MAIRKSSGNYYDKRSFLKDTPFKNFYLDTSSLPKINMTKGSLVQVPPQCEYRMDLFSYQQYGSSRLWWLIALANADTIKDPIWDFKSGIYVFVPRDTALVEQLPGAN
jgi:hypothetical protein